MSRLPKTIQDAIKVCRGIQIRYLWVDTLCIIQKNSEDFTTEVSQMRSIYANSLLTIAASDGFDCSQGCFQDRQPLQVEDCRISDDIGYVIWFAGTYHEGFGHYLWGRYLDTRAWVYQERMMAPRTIHFCGGDVIWECRELTTCQRCAIDPFPGSDLTYRPATSKLLFKTMLQCTSEELDRARFRNLWYSILYVYTKASLSNEDDKLSALAGMVQLLNRYTKYESSFGLWLPFFLDDLLWCSESSKRGAFSDHWNTVGLPSWSWVGIRGSIGRAQYFLRDETHVYCATLTQILVSTPFGQISLICAQLPSPAPFKMRSWAMKCRPIPVLRRSTELIPPEKWALGFSVEAYSYESAAFEQLTWDHYLSNTAYTKEQADIFRKTPLWRRYYYPDRRPKQGQHLICILIKRIWETLEDLEYAPDMTEYGLVLECVDADKNLFQRRGTCVLHNSDDSEPTAAWNEYNQALATERKHGKWQIPDDHDACISPEDVQRAQKFMIDRYSLFNEEEPMIEIEII